MRLFNKHLACVFPVMVLIGGPHEIKPSWRPGSQVQPNLADTGQRNGLLLYDLAGGADQLDQETSGLIAVELEENAIGGRVGIGPVADKISSAGAIRVDNEDGRIAYFPVRISLLDPDIEFAHISRIRVVLILVF